MKYARLLYYWGLCRRARNDCKNAPTGAVVLKSDKDRAFALLDGGRLTIVIDGSSNMREQLENLLWIPWGKSGDSIGFRNVAVDMYKQIERTLFSDPEIVLIGHSRGGAVAQSLGLMLANRKYDVCEVVSFGSPKVGGRDFVKACTKAGLNHIRVVTSRDIVAKLPFIRGKHYEKERHVLDAGKMRRIQAHMAYGALLRKRVIND